MTAKKKDANSHAARSIALHRRARGKVAIASKVALNRPADLALAYTPGVGAVSSLVARDTKAFRELTIKSNSVAVISDGSAVLGLGNIGPEGALPVLEGKCIIFKKFANIDAWPIALATQDTEQIIQTIKNIAPVFGGINLEDISAPRCFEIEERLKHELNIPVMHDDQHGTAIVVLAALINALKVVHKELANVKIIINGAGPAGTAVAYLIQKAGAKDIIVLDSKGAISKTRKDLDGYKQKLAIHTNHSHESGMLEHVLRGADIFIGLSRPGILNETLIGLMAQDPIVFALANPVPEIMPDEGHRAGVAVMATGRSDFPNQINNALVFPGIFRGALSNDVRIITDDIKLRAAYALASIIKKPHKNNIIPTMFDAKVVKTIASAVR